MSKIMSIAAALLALSDAKMHEEAAGAVVTGTASEPSGQDDEERLAQDQRDARRRAAAGRAEDAIRALCAAYPDAFARVAMAPPAPLPEEGPSGPATATPAPSSGTLPLPALPEVPPAPPVEPAPVVLEAPPAAPGEPTP